MLRSRDFGGEAVGRIGLVEVCAVRLDPNRTLDMQQPIWCTHSGIRILANGATFARTHPHGCNLGHRYVSYVRIIGYAWDSGPFTRCQSTP